MKVIKPVVIRAAQLISSSVAETEYAAYAPATDYAVFERRIYNHKIWESVQTPNVGHTPGTDALYWAEIGPTNRWAMLDTEISTATSAPLSLVATIAPGLVNSLALLEIDGAQLNVTVRDGPGGPVVYDYDKSLDGSVVYDWLQYFYEPFIAMHEVVLSDLPLYGTRISPSPSPAPAPSMSARWRPACPPTWAMSSTARPPASSTTAAKTPAPPALPPSCGANSPSG